MEEKETLVRTIETLNASIAVMLENHKKEVDALNKQIAELTAQVAWLNRQLFGRKSERLGVIDPNQTSLFAEEQAQRMEQAEEARNEAVGKIAKTKEDRARERKNRQMMEGLPVLERVVITPEGVDESLYKKIGEEVTRVVEHKPGQLYIKEIVREKWGLKDNTAEAPEGKKGVLVAPMPLLPINKGIAGPSLLATCRNHDVNPRDYLNDIIARMPYHARATHDELVQLLPHKWKVQHPESIMTTTE